MGARDRLRLYFLEHIGEAVDTDMLAESPAFAPTPDEFAS